MGKNKNGKIISWKNRSKEQTLHVGFRDEWMIFCFWLFRENFNVEKFIHSTKAPVAKAKQNPSHETIINLKDKNSQGYRIMFTCSRHI
jgi:hypothetical protein